MNPLGNDKNTRCSVNQVAQIDQLVPMDVVWHLSHGSYINNYRLCTIPNLMQLTKSPRAISRPKVSPSRPSRSLGRILWLSVVTESPGLLLTERSSTSKMELPSWMFRTLSGTEMLVVCPTFTCGAARLAGICILSLRSAMHRTSRRSSISSRQLLWVVSSPQGVMTMTEPISSFRPSTLPCMFWLSTVPPGRERRMVPSPGFLTRLTSPLGRHSITIRLFLSRTNLVYKSSLRRGFIFFVYRLKQGYAFSNKNKRENYV